jgi:hypothetical protein
MGTRAEELCPAATPVATELAIRTGSLKVVLSAGVLALQRLSPAEREALIAEAQGVQLPPDQTSEAIFRRRILEVFQEIEAARKEDKARGRSRRAKAV